MQSSVHFTLKQTVRSVQLCEHYTPDNTVYWTLLDCLRSLRSIVAVVTPRPCTRYEWEVATNDERKNYCSQKCTLLPDYFWSRLHFQLYTWQYYVYNCETAVNAACLILSVAVFSCSYICIQISYMYIHGFTAAQLDQSPMTKHYDQTADCKTGW